MFTYSLKLKFELIKFRGLFFKLLNSAILCFGQHFHLYGSILIFMDTIHVAQMNCDEIWTLCLEMYISNIGNGCHIRVAYKVYMFQILCSVHCI